MTQEEIKNLKPGDKISLEFTVTHVSDEHVTLDDSQEIPYVRYVKDCRALRIAKLVTPVPEFEVGDVVRVVDDPMIGKVYGHDAFHTGACNLRGKIVDEGLLGDMLVALDDCTISVNIHCLELVEKHAKDRYYVSEGSRTWNVVYCKEFPTLVATFVKSTHPAAKATAEAECERLNAEWRKQQEGTAHA